MSHPASPESVFRFGVFELDSRTGELRKAGVRLKVPEQSIQVLATLLERPGELVTREELRTKLWPDDTVVEFDHSINSAVKRLRQALGDTADTPRFIETLPRRGYRFVFPLDRAEEARPVRQTRSKAYGSRLLSWCSVWAGLVGRWPAVAFLERPRGR